MIELPGDQWVICKTWAREWSQQWLTNNDITVKMKFDDGVLYLVKNKRENCHLYDPWTEHIEKAEIFKTYLDAYNFMNSTVSTISPDFRFFVDLTPTSRYRCEK